MSKIEAGKLELENVPFSLEDLAERVEELHALRAEEKGLEFDVVIALGSEVRRLGDPHRVQQILNNLVLGFDSCVSKPLNSNDLALAIDLLAAPARKI